MAIDVACDKKKFKKHEPRSPYLTGDKVQLLSCITEKRFVHKKTLDYVSSFPLATNIYKTNSDEIKSKKKSNRKNKKSVLTLPNESTPSPEKFTLSDMNDSEYYSQNNYSPEIRVKKRTTIKNVRKPRSINKEFEFYDGDSRYVSQLNFLDVNSTDSKKNYKGDGKRISNVPRLKDVKNSCSTNKVNKDEVVKPHDVWAVLRNMNRFQFNPTPPMSDDSIVSLKKKKKAPKNRINCKDARLIQTCRTEKISYISSYEVDNTSRCSQSTSCDRITVINNQNDFSKVCEEFKERFLKTNSEKDSNTVKSQCDGKRKKLKRRALKGNLKALSHAVPIQNIELALQKGVDLNSNIQGDQKSYICNADTSSLTNTDDSQNPDNDEFTCFTNNVNKNQSIMQCNLKDSSIYSNSGINNGERPANETCAIKERVEMSPTGHVPPLNRLTRVTFNRGSKPVSRIAAFNCAEIQKRKPCLVTTAPTKIPKLTRAEIKKRLAALRFPLVILGKDQISSSMEVHNYDFPQFDGLNNHIWPYMVEWYNVKEFRSDATITTMNITSKENNGLLDSYTLKNNELPIDTYLNVARKKYVKDCITTTKNNTELKKSVICPAVKKPTAQFKDKMLNFFPKKFSDWTINNNKLVPSNTKTVVVCTETQANSHRVPSAKLGSSTIVKVNNYQRGGLSYPWAKAKLASDFIENVMKKIRNGVYYSQDNKYNPITETSMQTEITSDWEDGTEFSPKVTIKKKQNFPRTIPGFESSLHGLEIKTLNRNQIAVKHCVTNIMMQFDVTVPSGTKEILISPKTSLSFIPIEVTESHTKIFKCKTTILNTILPAELCSILPKMLNQFDSDLTPTSCPAVCYVLNKGRKRNFPTINETLPIKTDIPSNALSSEVLYNLSPVLENILRGMFSCTCRMPKNRVTTKITPSIDYKFKIFELLPKVSLKQIDISSYGIRLYVPEFSHVNDNKMIISNKFNTVLPITLEEPVLSSVNDNTMIISNKFESVLPVTLKEPISYCTALERYFKTLVPAYETYSFEETITDILHRNKLNINCLKLNIHVLNYEYTGKTLKVQMMIPDINGIEKNVSVTVNNLKIVPKLCNEKEDDNNQIGSHMKCIQYIKCSSNQDFENKDRCYEMEHKVANTKNKRKGFYKLYRKCKSTSCIPAVEKCNTSLNKIENLDDFFKIISSNKHMSSIFDGYSERKILSSVQEMKKWVTDINPRQALLILLLTNKKDTTNLVRFRPILLQGIAVNRITKATELDMEIEVIERENFNKLSQYEGISYLPASIENHDKLLDELYWIAKTTASDYQKPFDETSEKLLKALIEKRKTLNPSYLRVMARYVGLGLLKSPTKK